MKTLAHSIALLAAPTVATSSVLSARANVLSDIHRSIRSLWGQKTGQQAGAHTALQQRGQSGMLSVILDSDSLADLSRRTSFMWALNEADVG